MAPKKGASFFACSLVSHLLQHVDAGLAERGATFGLEVEVLHKGADSVLDRCGLERVQGAVIILLKQIQQIQQIQQEEKKKRPFSFVSC
jgi:hypothetical protein